MKLLSVAIPCYNSMDYMDRSIESVLKGGEEVEIIIVDDGSVDDTGLIADKYASKYPNIIKAVHQPNGGHGEAVNTGLKHATGKYFKVLDSDDRLDEKALLKVLDTIRGWEQSATIVDMLVCNFVYDKQGATRKKRMSYQKAFPQNKVFTWDMTSSLKRGQYILMHSVIYRRELLLACGLELPKHTFYVDNIFIFQPLPSVNTLYYMDVNLYWYFIGREDQSVNEKVMIGRIDQQIRVNKLMIDQYEQMREHINSKRLDRYMLSYLEIITAVTNILAIRSKLDENMVKKDELWRYLEEHSPVAYQKIRGGLIGRFFHIPGKKGLFLANAIYTVYRKLYGFN
ncbi:MAG: glycosyltransferase family 2 protein [Lachnospiraceae bacterium]|nr:glycosyltransferase family 2 protein [Lachnospiraceae bacterium]MDY5741549.1 glycosyltransferase family 2 protein [Lachnospiraceae bacterium]